MKTLLLLLALLLTAHTAHAASSFTPVSFGPGILISRLPAYSTRPKETWVVRDALSASDCTIGGGSLTVLCFADVAGWVPYLAGASSAAPTPTFQQVLNQPGSNTNTVGANGLVLAGATSQATALAVGQDATHACLQYYDPVMGCQLVGLPATDLDLNSPGGKDIIFSIGGVEVGRWNNATSRLKFTTGTAKTVPYLDANKELANLTLTNGQLVVGSTGNIPVAAAITAGNGIAVTNGAGSIAVAVGTQDGARVYNSALQAIVSNTATPITFDSERFDSNNLHSTSSNTSRLTAATAGVYIINCTISWAVDNSVSYRQTSIRLNGTTFIAVQQGPNNAASFADHQVVATLYKLAAADYVECIVSHQKGSNLNVNANANYSPEFSMQMVSQ